MGTFNLALLEALLSVGVPHERARNVVELLEQSVDERYGLHAQVLATKRDIAELQVASTRELADVQAANAREFAAVRREIAELRTATVREISRVDLQVAQLESKLSDAKSDLVRWMLAALTAQTALLVGAMRLL